MKQLIVLPLSFCPCSPNGSCISREAAMNRQLFKSLFSHYLSPFLSNPCPGVSGNLPTPSKALQMWLSPKVHSRGFELSKSLSSLVQVLGRLRAWQSTTLVNALSHLSSAIKMHSLDSGELLERSGKSRTPAPIKTHPAITGVFSLFPPKFLRKDRKGSEGQTHTSFGWGTAQQQLSAGWGGHLCVSERLLQRFPQAMQCSSQGLRSHHSIDHFTRIIPSLTLRRGRILSSVRRQIRDHIPFPKTRYADGTGMILLGQAELLALEVTNS